MPPLPLLSSGAFLDKETITRLLWTMDDDTFNAMAAQAMTLPDHRAVMMSITQGKIPHGFEHYFSSVLILPDMVDLESAVESEGYSREIAGLSATEYRVAKSDWNDHPGLRDYSVFKALSDHETGGTDEDPDSTYLHMYAESSHGGSPSASFHRRVAVDLPRDRSGTWATQRAVPGCVVPYRNKRHTLLFVGQSGVVIGRDTGDTLLAARALQRGVGTTARGITYGVADFATWTVDLTVSVPALARSVSQYTPDPGKSELVKGVVRNMTKAANWTEDLVDVAILKATDARAARLLETRE